MRIVLATGNAGKLRELRNYYASLQVSSANSKPFKVNHLTYFALLDGSSISSEDTQVDKIMNKATGCFINAAHTTMYNITFELF